MPVIRATIHFFAVAFLAALVLFPSPGLTADETSPADQPSPLRIIIGQTLRPEEVNRLVEVEGTVSFLGKEGRAVYFDMGSEAAFMPVNIARGDSCLADLLLRSHVRACGICALAHGATEGNIVCSLQVSNLNDVAILQLPEETWQRYPVCAISTLGQTNLAGRILHLRGKIQSVKPGNSFSLADKTAQVTVVSRQALPAMAETEIEVLGAWQQHGSKTVFQSGFFRPVIAANNPASLPTLTTTEQVRWLKPDEADQQYPVKVRGVITFLKTGGGKPGNGHVQDATGGIYFRDLDSSTVGSEVKVGDFCEVDGISSAGDFSPSIRCLKLTVLGAGQFPEPVHPNWDELISGAPDAQWVEVEGIVLSVKNRDLEIGVKGRHILCRIGTRGDFEHYLGALLQVRGVVLAYHDRNHHINGVRIEVPSPKFLSMETAAPDDPFSASIRSVKELLSYDPGETTFRQVKIAGQVIHEHGGVFYMMDGTNGVRLIPKAGATAGIGEAVEAVGFPEIDSPFKKPLLTLREAAIRKMGKMPMPPPVIVAPDDLLNREHDSTVVRLESRLLNMSRYPAEQVLELQVGTLVYVARLNTAAGQIPPLRVGSRLDLTGVYAISSDQSVPFELLLNAPDDIRVLELPSWWTVRHALTVVSALTLAMLLAIVWIGMLQHQVSKRTRSLKNEIAERKRAEDELVRTRLQHLVEQERTRIARDLHDDLGSRVTRIVLLLDELALQHRMPLQRVAEYPLVIAAAAREIIQSLDETVWAVNPRNDTLPHLIDYLGQFAIEFLRVANVMCRLDFPDHPPVQMITTEARHNLYLTVKEALNNAVRHAQATEVWLCAAASDKSLVLTVVDNGCGFEHAPAHSAADGLRNMRQRMEDMGGQFNIESACKTGTKVTLTYFWPPHK